MGILTFDFINEVITVPAAYTTIDMQTLIDEIRDEEEELTPAMAYHKIADAYGKDDLGGGVYTAITVRLIPDWQLKFEDRAGPDVTQVFVTDGNLVGGKNDIPIAASSFVQVIQQSSASGTISIPSDDTSQHLKYLIGSLYDSHTLIGNFIYWDPYGGNDASDGSSPANATQTFAQAQNLATDNNHDVIIALPTHPSGTTTTNELINLTKNTLRVRGPGYNFRIEPTTNSTQAVNIFGSNNEFSGFYITTLQTSGMHGMAVRGDNNLIKNCWISDARGHGIYISSANRNHITNCAIETTGTGGAGGNGIELSGTSSNNLINNCLITDAEDGISLNGTSLNDNVFENNLIYQNSNYGFDIGSGANNTAIRSGHTLANNTLGNTNDDGTDTIIETSIGGSSPSEIADAVWDEVISDRTTTGTAGKTLRDAKTKATLASLK